MTTAIVLSLEIRGYISAEVQLDLFETANIRLEVPYRTNQKEWKPTFAPFAKARKRIETLFSQLCEQFMIIRNYAKDTQGLIDLTGGDERFVAKIDSVFALPGIVKYGTYGTKIHEMLEMELAKMGQYAPGNQPIQHMIYLYSYAGQPWKTQYWIRQVMDRLYNSSENGYPGDEDQGGMSSWYVLSALGIYSDIVNGGVLELQMGNQPEKTRGTAKEDRPFSLSK